ncbi:MAG: hypothetical protein AMJ43_09455 [Coxiella sp. DG_40]|nr:MAG: hypothetical protein AMJ43_09455 [Coxiella sp. DG_40]
MSNSRLQGSGIRRRAEPSFQTPAKLGDMIREIMNQWISPQQVKFDSVVRLWSELLPEELRQHCRIMDISAGRLKVLVDSPSYMYDLQLRSSVILAELRRRCKQARIKSIKIALA